MAGKIKGLTIEIGADTTKVTKALSGVDRSLSETQKALKQVEKNLKLNPGSTEMLKQKQALLADQIKETEQKLKKQQAALAALNDKDDTPEVIEEQMKLQRQIEQTNQQLKEQQAAFSNFSVAGEKMKAVGGKMKEVGDKMADVGKTLTTKVTAPIVGLGVAAAKAFKEVDAGLDIIAEKTGATGEKLEEMKQIAQDIATTIPTSFETAGEAVGEIETRFGVTGDELEDLSTRFIKFAEINDTDVSSSVDEVQKALSAFGLTVADAGPLMDTLNATEQRTGASVETLTSGLVQNATAFQEMGLDIHQATVFMGQMETSGANSETVMQGLRKALKNAAKEGKPLNTALADLQDTILNGTDGMDGLTAAYDLFGKSGDQIYGAVKNGTLDFTNLATAAEDASGSVADTFENTLDPMDKFKTTMNKLKILGAQLITALGPTLSSVLEKLSAIFQKITDAWNKLSPGVQDAIVKAGLVVAAIGPVLLIIGKVVAAIGTVISTLGTIGPIIAGVISGPIGLILAAVAAVIAIGVALYKNWDTIKAKLGQLVAFFKTAFTTMKTVFVNIGTAIKTYFVDKFTSAKTTVLNIVDSIKTGIKTRLESARDSIKTIIDKIKGFFSFNVSLPHIPLPHFSITPAGWKIGDLLHGVKPSLGINWYRKAMDTPTLLNGATIFGSKNGKLLGGGEAGPEVIMGLGRYLQDANRTTTINMVINGAEGQDVRQLARIVSQEIQQTIDQKGNAYA